MAKKHKPFVLKHNHQRMARLAKIGKLEAEIVRLDRFLSMGALKGDQRHRLSEERRKAQAELENQKRMYDRGC